MKPLQVALLSLALVAAPVARAAGLGAGGDAGLACDRLAAFDDGSPKAPPVRLEDIRAEAAERACAEALASADPEPRHRMQLARALLGLGRTAEAVAHLERAGAEGVAAADFILGQLHHVGEGVARDHEAARRLYVRSFEGGYPKAALGLVMLFEDPASDLYAPDTAAMTRALLGLAPAR